MVECKKNFRSFLLGEAQGKERRREISSHRMRAMGQRFSTAWADIIAGAMMKEKESAHFARNDGEASRGASGVGKRARPFATLRVNVSCPYGGMGWLASVIFRWA